MRHLFLIGFLALGLTAAAQTSEMEINYVNNGLVEDLKQGREVKTGYVLAPTNVSYKTSFPDGSWKQAEILYFRAKTGSKNKALVLKCTDSQGNLRYMGLPMVNSGSDMWFNAEKALHETGAQWNTVFMCALAKLAAQKAL